MCDTLCLVNNFSKNEGWTWERNHVVDQWIKNMKLWHQPQRNGNWKSGGIRKKSCLMDEKRNWCNRRHQIKGKFLYPPTPLKLKHMLKTLTNLLFLSVDEPPNPTTNRGPGTVTKKPAGGWREAVGKRKAERSSSSWSNRQSFSLRRMQQSKKGKRREKVEGATYTWVKLFQFTNPTFTPHPPDRWTLSCWFLKRHHQLVHTAPSMSAVAVTPSAARLRRRTVREKK